MNSKKVFLHIDVDSFFVSAELTLRPELKNQDVAISMNTDNSMVVALSYSAKEKGAKVPSKLYQVKNFCPNLVNIKPNYPLYSLLSNKVFTFLKDNYTQEIEIGSIDEWYLDATDIWQKFGSVKELAKSIQSGILNELNLSVSIGVSWNKFLAKMSTDLNKPFGITITSKKDLIKIQNLHISQYCGIGKVIQKKLRNCGIQTIGDLAKVDKSDERYINIFKNQIDRYVDCANGFCDDKINKSKNHLNVISNSISFAGGYEENYKVILNYISNMTNMVCSRLKQRWLFGNQITLSLYYSESKKNSQSINLINPTNDIKIILENAIFIFDKLWDKSPLLGVGVGVGNLVKISGNYSFINLLNQEEQLEENEKIFQIVADLNASSKSDHFYTAKEFLENQSLNSKQGKYFKNDIAKKREF